MLKSFNRVKYDSTKTPKIFPREFIENAEKNPQNFKKDLVSIISTLKESDPQKDFDLVLDEILKINNKSSKIKIDQALDEIKNIFSTSKPEIDRANVQLSGQNINNLVLNTQNSLKGIVDSFNEAKKSNFENSLNKFLNKLRLEKNFSGDLNKILNYLDTLFVNILDSKELQLLRDLIRYTFLNINS